MIKVLFCTNVFEKVSNGPAKFAHLLVENSASAEMDVRILTEDISQSYPLVYKLPFNFPRIIKPLSQFWRMWKYHSEAMKIRKDFPFDVLVYNNALVGLWSAYRFPSTIGMINDYSNASSKLINVLRRKEKLNKRHIFYFVENMVARSSPKIIVNSNYLKDYLTESYKPNNGNFFKLYKGIENEFFSDNSLPDNTERITKSILFVKTNFTLGGLYTLIEAIKLLPYKITFTIIGPEEAHHQQIKENVQEYCASLTIMEYAEQRMVFELMRRHEVFCVPSFQEAFGVANIEAMACGCKIVGSNIGGIPEAVGNTGVSWLVAPGDPIKLKEAIATAFNTDIRSHKPKVDEHLNQFSAPVVVKNFKKILETALR